MERSGGDAPLVDPGHEVFFGQLAITVCFALLASLFVALTLIPVMSSKFLHVEFQHQQGQSTGFSARVGRMFEALNFGIVGINDINPTAAAAPFGGVKESGLGREGGREGIDEYLDVKLGGFAI